MVLEARWCVSRTLLLPRLTPLQFLVIRLLLDGRKTGRELRRELGSWGAAMSKAAFSQMMHRLQVAGLVRSDRVGEDSAGPPVLPLLHPVDSPIPAAYAQTYGKSDFLSLAATRQVRPPPCSTF